MVKKQPQISKYVAAGIISFLLFSLGITLGVILDYQRLQWAENINKQDDLSYQSLQLQYLLLSDVIAAKNNESCHILSLTLEDSLADLGYSLERLLEFKEKSNINEKEYTLLERKYLLSNLRYWLLSEKAKELCNSNVVHILYFYSEEHCDDCPNQGVILTYFKKKFEEKLLIFPINVDLEKKEPFIRTIKKYYNITAYPTVVIEGEKYQGILSKGQLGELICQKYITPLPGCEAFFHPTINASEAP